MTASSPRCSASISDTPGGSIAKASAACASCEAVSVQGAAICASSHWRACEAVRKVRRSRFPPPQRSARKDPFGRLRMRPYPYAVPRFIIPSTPPKR